LVDRLLVYEELSASAKVRQSKWAELVHRPIQDATLAGIRRSAVSGLPYGNDDWLKRLGKKLDLDLRQRPRGRPRRQRRRANNSSDPFISLRRLPPVPGRTCWQVGRSRRS
jgi:hypothetical protein